MVSFESKGGGMEILSVTFGLCGVYGCTVLLHAIGHILLFTLAVCQGRETDMMLRSQLQKVGLNHSKF